MKTCSFLLFLLLPGLMIGQKTDNPAVSDYKSACRSYYRPMEHQGMINDISASEILSRLTDHFGPSGAGLKLNYKKESPGGFHYSFTQTWHGIPVYQSEVKINTDKTGRIRSVFDNSENPGSWRAYTCPQGNCLLARKKDAQSPVPVYRRIENDREILTDSDGEVIYVRDLRAYSAAPDSLVSGKVFNPDPLTTAQTTYGGNYTDNNDAAGSFLDAQLQTVAFKASFTGSEFRLENDYLKILDFDLPAASPAVSTNGQFYFNRSQTGFEDVNVFFHINTYRTHVESLGFDLGNYEVHADPHAINGADNSYFAPNYAPPRLFFGTGGVDDAEDADVVVHEYGHFLSSMAAPNSNTGSERNALDEAMCDYIAASYSKALNAFGSEWVFNWDGHNEFWNGRIVNSTKVYPADLSSSIYKSGEIWSSALMAIHDVIGREATDSLIFQAHYSYAQNITMSDAAYLLIDADSLLNNGAYFCQIYPILQAKGFVPVFVNNSCQVGIEDGKKAEVSFQARPDGFSVVQEEPEALLVTIQNIAGQITGRSETTQKEFRYSENSLPAGVYLITAKSRGAERTFKWIKQQ